MATDEQIRDRVTARQTAAEIIGLANDAAETMTEDQQLAFWTAIREVALTVARLPEQKPQLVKARPMTDEQAREFEKEEIPFGRNCGVRVGDMVVDIDYLHWLADQTFIDDLRRYLANETIARQQ